MNKTIEPNKLSAIDAIENIRAGKLSSEMLVESCLSRIKEREPTIGAWEFLNTSEAIRIARNFDQDKSEKQLGGIPIGVKDIFNTHKIPTTYGSPIYKNNIPNGDASCVTQFRNEGGIVLGKTVTTEFAMFQPGKTVNPVNIEHTPGGSSSGSAAAVADFMVPIALGSQTVGSTIRPASFCGVVGYKPSFGLVDRTGVRTLAEFFDTVGVFSRTIKDAALFVSIISRHPSLSITTYPKFQPKIGYCKTPVWDYADADSKVVFEKAKDLISNAGGSLEEIILPELFNEVVNAQTVIVDFEAANSAAWELNFHKGLVSNKYIERAEIGLRYTEQQYEEAINLVTEAKNMFQALMTDIDVLLCPSAVGEAPKGLETTGDPIFNRLGTALKGPCLNVPGLRGSTNLPVGLQLIGAYKKDRQTLITGDWLHKIIQDS